MARFALERDIHFFNSISRELVDDVVTNTVMLLKLDTNNSKTNIYGESKEKWYFQGVNVNAMIDRDPTTTSYNEFGADQGQTAVFRFNKFSLREKEIYPEIGDLTFHNQAYFEISNVREDQLIGGRTGEPENPGTDTKLEKFSIVVEGFMVRKSNLNIQPRIR